MIMCLQQVEKSARSKVWGSSSFRDQPGTWATHLMMASSSIFTMQYGSLLPVLEGQGTALSVPPATAWPPPNPQGSMAMGDQSLQP